jgi:hypothetical protein
VLFLGLRDVLEGAAFPRPFDQVIVTFSAIWVWIPAIKGSRDDRASSRSWAARARKYARSSASDIDTSFRSGGMIHIWFFGCRLAGSIPKPDYVVRLIGDVRASLIFQSRESAVRLKTAWRVLTPYLHEHAWRQEPL